MTSPLQGVFLADGPSDLPLAQHLEHLCADNGTPAVLTVLDPRRLPESLGRTVVNRLEYLIQQQVRIDVAFVHRDAEAQEPQRRFDEIADGAQLSGIDCPVVPVVPIRMTEAWLLLDEAEIRRVAGRPGGRTPLGLPSATGVERVVDPKSMLQQALLSASETTGRRRERFVREFGLQRALLLERLDTGGPVTQLSAWQRLRTDIAAALSPPHE